MSALGFVLRKPFGGVGECETDAVPSYAYRAPGQTARYKFDVIGTVGNSPCYQRMPSLAGSPAQLGTEPITVFWPTLKGPELSKRGSATVGLIDGAVHSVSVVTHGVVLQTRDFELVQQRYGTPTTSATVAMQNRMGANYDVVRASWALPQNSAAVYLGAVTQLDEGHFDVSTAEWQARAKAQREAQDAGKPKL